MASAPLERGGRSAPEQTTTTQESSPYAQFTQPQQVEKAAADILSESGTSPQVRLNRLEAMFQAVPQALIQGMQLDAVSSFLGTLSNTLLSRPIDQAKARMESFLQTPELLQDPTLSAEKKQEIALLISNLREEMSQKGKALEGPLSDFFAAQKDPAASYNAWLPNPLGDQEGLRSHITGKNLLGFLTHMSKVALETHIVMQQLEDTLRHIPAKVEHVQREQDDQRAEDLLSQLASLEEVPVEELRKIPV